jgi:crotonobetainyl-CoA:carnitine CoA-transferase CaiB-like acyl-CoA transferase
MAELPLKGLRVIELARILAGPWAGQTLADLGAEVIKIESKTGDDTRTWGPPFINTGEETNAAYYHSCNRGKQSVSLDFKDKNDLLKLKNLIASADILIENFKVGGLDKYGLDYKTLHNNLSIFDILFDYWIWSNWALCKKSRLRFFNARYVWLNVNYWRA